MRKLTGLIAAFLLMAAVVSARTDVSITRSGFVPPIATIPLSENIRWTNNDIIAHTVTSDTGVWDSGNIAPGGQYERTFSNAGGFRYHCTYHPAMVGTVNAGNAAVAPSSIGRVKALFK